MKIKSTLIFLLVALLLGACGSEYTKTEFGSEYKFIEKGDGNVAGLADLLLVQMENVSGDSVVMKTMTKDGLALPPNQGPDILTSIFKLCSAGDSVHIKVSAEEYAEATRSPISQSMIANGFVLMKIKVTEVVDRQAYIDRRNVEAAEEAKRQLELDKTILEKYAADNNLAANQTDDGLYYVIEKAGRGKKPTNGQMVAVNYVVRLLDGTFIDSSDEELNRQNNTYNPNRTYGPYRFRLGTGAVIKGWDLGIGLIEQGTKAKFLVPSGLGYGANPRPGGAIPPNAVLIFDIELVEIEE